MIRLALLSTALLSTTSLLASTIEESRCINKGGIYYHGVCTQVSLTGEVSGYQVNTHRTSGGNEASIGDYAFELETRFSKDIDGKHFKTIFIDISLVPDENVLDYQEKNEQNYHNQNRLRADGYMDRPWMIANIGAEIDLSDSQELTILAGSFEANGLHPLKGKPSKYYLTAPYGLVVRYDKGLQFNYELKDQIEKILSASFSVIDGDSAKGQSEITPDDSRANSYPSVSGGIEVQLMNALKQVATNLKLDNHNLYIGVNGSMGDAGSYKGEKRRQNDVTSYLGYMVKTAHGEGEVRIFHSMYDRNLVNDGNGNHTPAVNSQAYGLEVAFRNFKTKYCDVDTYVNYHEFESNGTDGEFTWGQVRSLKGWTVGMSCNNFKNVSNLNFGIEYGRLNTIDANGEELHNGQLVNLVFSYKLGAGKKSTRK